MHFHILEWDTAFFGFPIARIGPESISELLPDALRAQGIRMAYLMLPPTDIEVNSRAEVIGARLADQRTTFLGNIAASRHGDILAGSLPKGFCITAFEGAKPSAELYALNLQSGIHSRFRSDSGFGPKAYERLYDRWIENCVAEKATHDVLILNAPDGTLAGYFAIAYDDLAATGVVVLFAVDTRFRGQGLALHLAEAAVSRFKDRGLTKLRVVTQGINEPSKGIWAKYGFPISEQLNVWHLWL